MKELRSNDSEKNSQNRVRPSNVANAYLQNKLSMWETFHLTVRNE